ncbi:MAG: hypothetical protein A2289_26510 [Deltaproteobacteria bacterium RIFOXYA12_FULL_58_15]|nr:MAG: hypothetical protein A2289_26510 [Deltaproteobacteria bacterium RIFOXYA12_FULL_58_15]OGR07713.1 MAG: hypothetical protein A2341_06735 [Deltaproteobacteria bacterium RIFOXYB12_FULL_58_9]
MRGRQTHSGSGFTLIEVAISIAILAIGLGALLDAQANSLHNVDRARDLTIATLLARSKMIDVEQKLFDEGFTMGEEKEEGSFEEEGQKDYEWAYRIAELEIDLSSLTSMCSGFSEDTDGESGDCEAMLSGFAGPFESLTDELGRSIRLVELTVSWKKGKFTDQMTLRALVTREDFNLQPMGEGGGGNLLDLGGGNEKVP